MRKLALALLMLLLCVPVMAADTGGASWDSQGIGPIPGSDVNSLLNETGVANHGHSYDKYERDNAIGIGVDFVVYESEAWWAQEVTIEPRWDFENDEAQVFAVAKVNLHKLWNRAK